MLHPVRYQPPHPPESPALAPHSPLALDYALPRGAVAQLGEHDVRIVGVEGSNPFRSTIPGFPNLEVPGNASRPELDMRRSAGARRNDRSRGRLSLARERPGSSRKERSGAPGTTITARCSSPRTRSPRLLDFLARMIMHIPTPRLHTTFFYGWYSNSSRGRRRKLGIEDLPETRDVSSPEVLPDAAERRRLRRLWATMIRRIYEVSPLTCTECGSEMKIVSFIMDPPIIRKILGHLAKTTGKRGRAPPS